MKENIKSILENYSLDKVEFGLEQEFKILSIEHYIGSISFELEFEGKKIDIEIYHENNQILYFEMVEDTDDFNYDFKAEFSSLEIKGLCQRLFSVWADVKRNIPSSEVDEAVLDELKSVFETLGFSIEENDIHLKIFKGEILVDSLELVDAERVNIGD